MKSYIILLLLFCNLCYSHRNVAIQKKIRNVEVISSTGYYSEKSYKPIMLAEYISMLCKKRKFKNKILFVFRERGFKGDSIRYYSGNSRRKNDKKEIILEFFKNDFDILKSLSLIDYLINNTSGLPINKEALATIYETYTSDLAKELLHKKVYRPTDVVQLSKQGAVSYYFMDNQYHFYEKGKNEQEVLLYSLDTVLNFKSFNDFRLAVMVSQNKILYFDNVYKANYKSIPIKGSNYYFLQDIKFLRDRILIIELSEAMCCDKIIAYLIEEDKVIGDLKEILLEP